MTSEDIQRQGQGSRQTRRKRTRCPRSVLFCAFVALLAFGRGAEATPDDQRFDVVIYGATPSGIIAAKTVADLGYRAIILEAGEHVGGIMTSGLSASDVCHPHIVGGLSKKFFQSIGEAYGKELSWRFEPHVAQSVFDTILKNQRITIKVSSPLQSLRKTDTKLDELVTTSGIGYRGKIFIDATYTGDLLKAAEVRYTLGRESTAEFNEKFAGFNLKQGALRHTWSLILDAQAAEALPLLPNLLREPFPEVGSGDHKIQAYNYRLCITRTPSNRAEIPVPKEYDSRAYQPLGLFLEQHPTTTVSDIFTLLDIPGDKIDLNNGGPFSSDLIGGSWRYPEASLAERVQIEADHKRYLLGLLHYLRTDRRVPESIRQVVNSWGLCKDEFRKNNNWPPLLYVREGRRMVGEYVLTERDLLRARRKSTSVGLASCPIETHAIQRVVVQEGSSFGRLQNEGIKSKRINPYQIPYEALVPKANEATNLIVPVALSATQIAYSSLRMEPVFMTLGESAGVAAVQAIVTNQTLLELDRHQLRETLLQRGQVLGPLPKERR